MKYQLQRTQGTRTARGRRGAALVPTLVVVSSLAIFGLALLTAGLSGARSVSHQDDDYKLTSAVESVAVLTAENIWSGYLADQGGQAGNIETFQVYLDGLGIADNGVGGPPDATEGEDALALADVPGAAVGNPELNNVNIDSVRVFRRDEGDATQLYLTVSASTNRGAGMVNPVLNRAVQQVYTVEPATFEGFEYGILANNVNCVFCHAQVDSVERFFNTDPGLHNTFDRVKVGTLESLVLRHDMDGDTSTITDYDADSFIAGSLYARGPATDHAGALIGDWSQLSMTSYQFNSDGKLVQDQWGDLSPQDFTPAGDPPGPGENLYLDYPSDYNDMVDGKLPVSFPAPIPDNGGIDPATGLTTTAGADNKVVDDEEFYALAKDAEGEISAGYINVSAPGEVIDEIVEYQSAMTGGNLQSADKVVTGNVILTGTKANPITIEGTVAIDGDLIITGYVKGSGTLVVRGNVYVPVDVQYLDGKQYLPGDSDGNPTGPRTFGIDPDGNENKLGVMSGGNILIGDYLRSSSYKEDGAWSPPAKYEIVTGDTDGEWSFVLAEMSIFNRGEWAKSQPVLPGPGDDFNDPSTWSQSNLPADGGSYQGAGYVPRYYQFGPGDTIPMFNKGVYYDGTTDTWQGPNYVSLAWDPDVLTYLDPNDPSDPYLYDLDGNPKAVVSRVTPNAGWIDDGIYKILLEQLEDLRTPGDPLKIDALLYTNNAIFGIVNRYTWMLGRMVVNGALVAADMGLLVPSYYFPQGMGSSWNLPSSPFMVGLQLNYDRRVKNLLNVVNPNQVEMKRTLWNPTANIL